MANNYTPTSIPPVGPPPPKKGSKYVPPELSRIPDALAEGGGVWRSCSGCHCLNEGVPTGDWSEVMRCHLGIGCRECGGIGAIWDMTDYADMAAFMNQPPHEHLVVTDQMIADAREAFRKQTGAEDYQLDGWIDEALRVAIVAALAPEGK